MSAAPVGERQGVGIAPGCCGRCPFFGTGRTHGHDGWPGARGWRASEELAGASEPANSSVSRHLFGTGQTQLARWLGPVSALRAQCSRAPHLLMAFRGQAPCLRCKHNVAGPRVCCGRFAGARSRRHPAPGRARPLEPPELRPGAQHSRPSAPDDRAPTHTRGVTGVRRPGVNRRPGQTGVMVKQACWSNRPRAARPAAPDPGPPATEGSAGPKQLGEEPGSVSPCARRACACRWAHAAPAPVPAPATAFRPNARTASQRRLHILVCLRDS